MRIEIRARGVALTESLERLTRRRLYFAVGRFAASIEQITVRLSDVNGPRGGVDKRCRIAVATRAAGTLVVDDIDEQFPAAIGRAAARMGRSLGRALDGAPGGRRPSRRSAGLASAHHWPQRRAVSETPP
ncbi:MAG: hypothetical protein Tsb0020_41750 [Haliangiales bacterium]